MPAWINEIAMDTAVCRIKAYHWLPLSFEEHLVLHREHKHAPVFDRETGMNGIAFRAERLKVLPLCHPSPSPAEQCTPSYRLRDDILPPRAGRFRPRLSSGAGICLAGSLGH